MTHVAFYAPLKPPTHPVPSGDRTIALNLMRVIQGGGATLELVSDLRMREFDGNAARQAQLAQEAEREVARLIPYLRDKGADLWVTYHNYYKAPDLIGPAVADALNLPYVIIEATRARKRLTGPWADFAAYAEAASDAANLILYFTQHDAEALHRDRMPGQHLAWLRPFLGRRDLPKEAQHHDDPSAPMLAVGMMRYGDKLDSFTVMADTLTALPDSGWTLEIAGDGPARPEVEALMAPFGDKVRFLGQVRSDELDQIYARAGLFFWPGVNEAFGVVYLEAQAAGLTCVAQDRPGVRDVVRSVPLCPVEGGAKALAGRLSALLADPDQRVALGQDAQAHVAADHLQGSAVNRFWSLMDTHLGVRP